MAKKKGNGGQVYDLTVEILKSIREEVRGLREEMREELRGVNTRLDATNKRLDGTNARIDHLVGFTRERWRDHEERLRRLEKRR